MPIRRYRPAIAIRLNWHRRRVFSRGNEIGLILLGIAAGGMVGLVVCVVSGLSGLMHRLLYGVGFGEGLSGTDLARGWPLVVVLVSGGFLTVVLVHLRRRRGSIIDPIEANALYGGRMSLTDSIWVRLQNLASNGFGLSAGLEVAYTQLSSGIASNLGVKLWREDVRVLVGCGSVGAIAAALAVIGMSAFDVAVIGGPLAMTFLALAVVSDRIERRVVASCRKSTPCGATARNSTSSAAQ